MKSKGLYILLAVLAALIVVTWLYREGKKPPKSLKLLSDLGQIEKVTLTKGDSSITLVLAGDEWRVTYPIESLADGKVVREFIEGLDRMELSGIVTTRREMHETFAVDEEKGMKVLLRSSSDTTSFIIGKSSGFGEGYVRLSAEDAVHLAKNFPRNVPSRGLDYWRDKSILSIPKKEVEGIDLVYPSESFGLRREEGIWKLNGADVDSSRLFPILVTFENLRADGFFDVEDFKPEVTVGVKLPGDRYEKILIGEATDSHYPVMREGVETGFLVAKWKIDRLKKKPGDFQ